MLPALSARQRGRPRNRAIDARILSSALRVFGRTGWLSFTMEEAAICAAVSKATLYLRWGDKRSLLTDALQSAYPLWDLGKNLTIQAKLIALVTVMTVELTEEPGWALHRALRDPDLPHALRSRCRKIVEDRLAAIDLLLAQARSHGLIKDETAPELLRNMLVGAAMSTAGNLLLTGRRARPGEIETFADDVIRWILRLN